MAGSTFGTLFRVTTAGESHGPGNIVIVDGMPPGILISEEFIQSELDRRKPGQSRVTTARRESDQAEILSGVFDGKSTGTPIAILVRNEDQRSRDYSDIKEKYRPGHADYTFDAKYGVRDYRGGGRSSARETVARVAAGALAKLLLAESGIIVTAWVKSVGIVTAQIDAPEKVSADQVEANIVRCPDAKAAEKMIALIDEMRRAQDSVGGTAEISATGVPAGWGEPVFDKLRADLGKALFSLPAVQGVEFGAGFAVAGMRGSEHNDIFVADNLGISTRTNRHGGMLGGISSGMPVIIRCAVKPTSSLSREQETVTKDGEPTRIITKGRHDPCLLPRFIPMAEAMVAITLADHYLRQKANR